MWQRLMHVRSTDPIKVTQGRLLIGTAASLFVIALLYIPVAIFIPPAWLVPALIAFAGICFGVLMLARRGQIVLGGSILTTVMLVLIPTATTSENLLQGPVGLVFLLPMLVIGMTARPVSILGVGAVSALLLLGVQISSGAPWNERTAALLLMLVIFGIILWLIFQSMDRALRQALQRTQEAETTRTLLEARETDLIQTRDALISQNDDLHRLVSLVQELEVPMIPVDEGVMVVPLVGRIDTRRADHLTSRVLSAVSARRLATVIIDVSGVQAIDTHVVQHLQALIQGIRLLGAQTVLTGMSPEVALAIVHLGVDFSWVRTAGSVQEVLADKARPRAAA